MTYDELADYCKEASNEIIRQNEEIRQLKKQLENNSKINVADHKYASTCEDKVIILETQQKKFINYLEDEIKDAEKIIKSLYKEIIGDKDE